MGIESLYYLHGLYVNGATLVSQQVDAAPAVNAEDLTAYASGHESPLFRGQRGQMPDIPLTTSAVKQVLDLIVAGGNNYCLDLSSNNTDLLYKQGQDLGIRYAAAVAQHVRMRLTKAFWYWDTIQATHQQDATIQTRVVAVYDGTNNPIVPAGTITLSGTPAVSAMYTLGPIKVNGSWLSDEQDWSLASGVAPEQAGAGGEIWPSYTGIKQLDQIVTIGAHGAPWKLQGLAGTAITALILYLRKKNADGTNVPNGTAEHIKITATNGLFLPQDATAANNDPVRSGLRAMLRPADANSDCITINTASAIA